MSTRSGKRIHSSFHEKATSGLELVVNSERKTRSKRMKDVADVSMPILKKKRNNYVSYPTDDEMNSDITSKPDDDTKVSRALRKNTLKDLNIESNTNNDHNNDDKIRTRKPRRGKKLSDIHIEETTSNVDNLENVPAEVPQPKSKKNKKMKTSVEPQPEEIQVETEVVNKKLNKKKKKGKKARSILTEDVLVSNDGKNVIDRGNVSVDSFHSAAGSPQTGTEVTEQTQKNTEKKSSNKRHSVGTTVTKDDSDDFIVTDDCKNNDTFDKKDKTVIENNTFDKTVVDSSINKKVDFNNSNVSQKRKSTSFCKGIGDTQSKKLSNVCNSTYEKNEASTNNIDTLEQANHSPIRLKTKQKSKMDVSNTETDEKPITQSNDLTDLNETRNSNKKTRQSSLKNTTYDNINDIVNTTYEKDATIDKKDSTFDKSSTQINTTFEKVVNKVNSTFEQPDDTTFEKDTSTFDKFKKGALKRISSIVDATFDKSNTSIASLTKEDFEKDKNISSSSYKRTSLHRLSEKVNNSTTEVTDPVLEKISDNIETRNSLHRISSINNKLNSTFDKGEPKPKEDNSKSSLISSDNSNITEKSDDLSRISITSDDTTENIINTTPVLIESSMEVTQDNISKVESPVAPQTPLKREGTFTKDEPTLPETSETPSKRKSLPAAGCTPYNINKGSHKKSVLNVTRSIEKSRASVELAPRMTRVMFCSPVDNPVLATTEKRKIIKSNLKGSNKSFMFDESVSALRPSRKRSYTHSDVDEARVKRTRLTDDLQHSVNRLSRPRTTSATAKLTATPTKKPVTPSKTKSDAKPIRTKLPNFAALHQRRFDKMESLDECQERKAKRAKQLLTPTGSTNLLGRISPTNNTEVQKPPAKEAPTTKEKTDTPAKKLPTLESLRPGFTRFGFKLNLDVNPFSIPSKTEKEPKRNGNMKMLKSKVTNTKPGVTIAENPLPSLIGATSVRREVAKQTVMREKSFTDRRSVSRKENRTIIKGVRTNRRFELQMKLRNLE